MNRFEYPDNILEISAKRDYLSTAAYKLTSNVSLRMQRVEDTTFFIGIGSSDYPFKGTFNGNGKTVTLLSSGNISFNANMSPLLGFIGRATDAKIINTNIRVENDLIANRSAQVLRVSPLVGRAENCEISNCNVTVVGSKIGAEYADGEVYVNKVYVGGLVGESLLSIIKDCTVTMNESTLQAKACDVVTGTMYANFSVGGIIGFSNPGSNNVENIGRVGNQLINCKFISNNTTQRDVIIGSIRKGEEVVVGGIVGCTFNNMIANNCSVNVTKGNIVAQKTCVTDDTRFGTNAGGIVGRLEHTGELKGCTVNGNYLNIISKSPENESNAGGIVGIDIGPYHRNVVSLNNCSFNGNGTSCIVLDVTADNTVNKWNALGGIAGYGSYRIKDCTVNGVTLKNHSANINKCFVGDICGIYQNKSGFWASGEYFVPNIAEITNCLSSRIIFDTSSNVKTGELYACEQ